MIPIKNIVTLALNPRKLTGKEMRDFRRKQNCAVAFESVSDARRGVKR